jgi:hypothetical protein
MVMRIPVIFINGSSGVICGEDLDELLDRKLIVAFRRSSGVVIVGRDETRGTGGDRNGSWRDRKRANVPARGERAMLTGAYVRIEHKPVRVPRMENKR